MENLRQAAADLPPEFQEMLNGMLNDGASTAISAPGSQIRQSASNFQLTRPDGSLDLNEARRLHRYLQDNPSQRAFLEGPLDRLLAENRLTVADLEAGAFGSMAGSNDWATPSHLAGGNGHGQQNEGNSQKIIIIATVAAALFMLMTGLMVMVLMMV